MMNKSEKLTLCGLALVIGAILLTALYVFWSDLFGEVFANVGVGAIAVCCIVLAILAFGNGHNDSNPYA